jgi:hypothetical protein
MANPNTPYGLNLVQRLGAADFRANAVPFLLPAANSNAIYVGDPVIKTAASADSQGVDGCDLATAGAGNLITGVVVGFLGSCTAGAANPSFFGSSGTPGPLYRPASTSLDYYVLVNDRSAGRIHHPVQRFRRRPGFHRGRQERQPRERFRLGLHRPFRLEAGGQHDRHRLHQAAEHRGLPARGRQRARLGQRQAARPINQSTEGLAATGI